MQSVKAPSRVCHSQQQRSVYAHISGRSGVLQEPILPCYKLLWATVSKVHKYTYTYINEWPLLIHI